MIDYIDYLVLLLSTDWFRPYWSDIAIEVDDSVATSIQKGCREIVKQILSGVDNYVFVSFSEQRRKETHVLLESLLNKLGAEEAFSATLNEWTATIHDETTAAWVYARLTRDLFADRIGKREPRPDPLIERVMADAEVSYELDPVEFREICTKSQSAWDAYIGGLTPDQPTFLADTLAAVLRVHRFRSFWESMIGKLTPHQRQDLIAWYRSRAKSSGSHGISPSCVV
jgi:hypothetical protein